MRVLCLAAGLVVSSVSFSSASEQWIAASRTATAITGDITLDGNKITFGNGTSLRLSPLRGRPGVFALNPPADPELLNGNTLCGRSAVTYLTIARSGENLYVKAFDGPDAPAQAASDPGPQYGTCSTYNFVSLAWFGDDPPPQYGAGAPGGVLWAQERLNELGYDAGPEDGAMGRRTRNALSAFQRDRGLKVTAAIDEETEAALAGSGRTDGPSFDCRKASAAIERAICASPALSRLDAELAAAFKSARDQLAAADAALVLDRQRDWLAERDRCASDISCLEASYSDRIAELRGEPSGEAAAASEQPVAAQGPATETITILGAEFPVAPSPYLNEIPAEWEPVRGYVPAWLHAAPDDPIDTAGRLRFVEELEADLAKRVYPELDKVLERHLADYLALWPDRNRDYFELELAGMCFANESGGYIPRSTLALCQEFVAMTFVVAIVRTAHEAQQENPPPMAADPSAEPVAAPAPATMQHGPETAKPATNGSPEPLETFKDCDTCPEMVVLPAGSYWMGSDGGDSVRWYMSNMMIEGAFKNLDPRIPVADQSKFAEDLILGGGPEERPRHRVTFDYEFAIGRYELTVAEYRTFLEETGYGASGNCYTYEPDPRLTLEAWGNTGYPEVLKLEEIVKTESAFRPERSFLDPGYAQTDRHPAVCVSVADARVYLAWLSEKTGRRYRLPSEAEWEYAARGGTDTAYSFGDDVLALCEYANFDDGGSESLGGLVACDDGYPASPAPVGAYKPNPFGLYDVHGNVWEPVEDCFHPDYAGAPTDGSFWEDDTCAPDGHVLRSYSWESPYFSVRSAQRCLAGKEWGRSNMTGIRVAVSMTDGAWDLK